MPTPGTYADDLPRFQRPQLAPIFCLLHFWFTNPLTYHDIAPQQACDRELALQSHEHRLTQPQLPKQLWKFVPSGVLPEETWRSLGIRQSPGWEMYMRHGPVSDVDVGSSNGLQEPHVLLFRRPKDYDLMNPPLSSGARAARRANLQQQLQAQQAH